MEWILTSSQLPEPGKKVLLCQRCDDGVYVHLGWKNDEDRSNTLWTDACCFDDKGDYVQLLTDQISHWKLMPEGDVISGEEEDFQRLPV
jgi:hypothetical protein